MGSGIGKETEPGFLYKADDGAALKYFKTLAVPKISYYGYWWTLQNGVFANNYLGKSFTITAPEGKQGMLIMKVGDQVKYFYLVGVKY